MGPHLCSRPIAQPAVVHGKTIVMFCDRYNVLCARFFERLGPSRRIEALGLEHGNEIFVAELVLWSVGNNVVLVCVEPRLIHISRIPFAAKSRNRIRSPMNENAELGVLVPLRSLIFLQ